MLLMWLGRVLQCSTWLIMLRYGSRKMEFRHDRKPIGRTVQFSYWKTKPSNGFPAFPQTPSSVAQCHLEYINIHIVDRLEPSIRAKLLRLTARTGSQPKQTARLVIIVGQACSWIFIQYHLSISLLELSWLNELMCRLASVLWTSESGRVCSAECRRYWGCYCWLDKFCSWWH